MKMNTKTFSEIQELKISQSLGWSRVSGSGARDCLPGDVEGPEWLGECKTHASVIPRITFKYDVWLKISNEAMSTFKRPVLFVDNGSQLLEYTWCVILACEHPGVAVEFPPNSSNFSNRTNINFVGNQLRRYLHDSVENDWEDVYIRLSWQGQDCHLLRFPQFARWFGEYR